MGRRLPTRQHGGGRPRQRGNGPAPRRVAHLRYPVWIDLGQDNFNAKALPTAQLETALFIEPGSVKLKPGSDLTFTPLIETSDRAGEIPAAALQFAQPEEVAKQIKASGKRTLAALVTGKFKTAFPDGAPKDPEPADKKDAAKPAAAPAFLKESASSSI